MKPSRTQWRILAVALLAAATWLVVGRRDVTTVDVAVVTAGPLRVTVDEAGTTRVRGHADVNAPVAGRWVPAARRPGDAVRAGDVLGALYPAPLDAREQEQARARLGAAEAAQLEAETRVTATRAALEDATRSLDRTQRLVGAGGMAPQELERARDAVVARRSEYDGARLRVTAATFERDFARSVIATMGGSRGALRVVAPVSGTVLRLVEEHERVVAPGTPLAEVGDPRDFEVVIPLLTSDAARVREGAEVAMTFGPAGDTLRGRVRRIEPAAYTRVSALGVEEQRVNAVATAPATDLHVGDHYRVQARVTVWASANVLRVPGGALLRSGDGWFVFVVDGNRVRRRAVTVGERGDAFVEVRSGLAESQRVVLYPGDMITDGARVRSR
jgi:HlyD family secretion protein